MQNTPTLNREQRRQIEAAKRTEAPRIRARVGAAPSVDGLKQLVNEMRLTGVITDKAADALFARSEVWDGLDERPRLIALDRLMAAAAPMLARRALSCVEAIFGSATRIEFAALEPQGAGRRTFGGALPGDHDRLVQELARSATSSNLYVGRDPRAATWAGTAAAKSGDVAESRFAVFDFDRHAEETVAAWDARRARLQVQLCGCDPLVVVSTGGGLHGWFRLEPSADPSEMARRVGALNELSHAIGSDRIADLPRIVRLPWSINFPDAKKRAKGRTIALAHPIHENVKARTWDVGSLDTTLRQAFGIQHGTPLGASVEVPAGRAAGRDRAPSSDIAVRAMFALPNGPDGPFKDRAEWTKVGHAIAGAAGNTPEAKAAWLEWSSRFNEDTSEAERFWDTLNFDTLSSGWRNLREFLDLHGGASERDAIRAAAAQAAFDDELSADEIDRVAASAKAGAVQGIGGRKTIADKLASIVCQHGELWMDRAMNAYVRFRDRDGALRDYALASKAGRLAVQALIGRLGSYPSDEQLKQAMSVLAAMARTKGQVHDAELRFAADAQSISLHLDGPRNEILDIKPARWAVVSADQASVRFVTPDGAEAIPTPVRGVQQDFLSLVDKHIGLPAVAAFDPDDHGVQTRAAVLTFIASTLKAGAHSSRATLVFEGPAGSGKTNAVRVLGNLLDPHAHALGTVPRDSKQLAVLVKNRGIVRIDNASSFTAEMNDTLCLMATGGSYQVRELYTDGEVTAWKLDKALLISAISLSLPSDVEDRAVRIAFERRSAPWSERAAHDAFEADRPALLGALADLLANGLAGLPLIDMDKAPVPAPRFRDAAELAEACARSMGWRDWLLTEALVAARREGQQALFAGDPLAQRLVRVLKACPGSAWTGTAAELLAKVEEVGGPTWGPRGRPTTATQLSARLTRIEPAWTAAGGGIRRGFRGRGDAKQKTIALTANDRMIQEAQNADPFGL